MTAKSMRLTGITFRRITPRDTAAVRDLHATLDTCDGYYRFFGPLPKNLEHLAAEIAKDDPTHWAVGAFLDNRLIGVANYVVLEDEARRAEVAVVVAHEDQEPGIGAALLGHLADDARRQGIELVVEIMSTNSRMMELLMDIDLPMAVRREEGIIQVVLRLLPDPSASGAGACAPSS